mgnify:FL=1
MKYSPVLVYTDRDTGREVKRHVVPLPFETREEAQAAGDWALKQMVEALGENPTVEEHVEVDEVG